MAIRLIGIDGPLSGKMVELESGTHTIGRAPECEVHIPNDRNTSRQHAVIRVRDGVAEVEDMGSTNGTFVNGARVLQETIREGDTLRIGDCVFQVRVVEDIVGPGVQTQDQGGDGTWRPDDKVRYAGFWVRLGASIIDHIILTLGFTLLGYIGFLFIGAVRNNPLCWGIIYGVMVLVGWAAYYAWLDGSCGQTIGRKAVGIRVITESGAEVNTSDVLTRYLVHFLAARLAPFVVAAAVVGVALLVLGGGASI